MAYHGQQLMKTLYTLWQTKSALWKIAMFKWNINYKWAIFNSYLTNNQRVILNQQV
jgi:hypothetical protein